MAHYQGHLLEAEAHYRDALESKPEEMAALEGVASVQMSSNNLQGGIDTYKQLVNLRPVASRDQACI